MIKKPLNLNVPKWLTQSTERFRCHRRTLLSLRVYFYSAAKLVLEVSVVLTVTVLLLMLLLLEQN